jgi:proteasome lid subunit RPN8/RPN11
VGVDDADAQVGARGEERRERLARGRALGRDLWLAPAVAAQELGEPDGDAHWAREDSPAIAAIRAHAAETWPEECCGIVLAGGSVRRVANVHETPRTAFRFAPADALLLARLLDGPAPPLAVYHSHVDALPSPSATDLALAARYPRLGLLIVHA